MSERLEQMLNDQINVQDPFAIAKQQSKMGPDIVNPMFDFAPQEPAQPKVQEPKSLVAPAGPVEKMDFSKSDLPSVLKKFNIDSKNLAMNDLGRIQLIGRLRVKFGPDYEKNPEALKILSKFDDTINEFQDEKRKSMNDLIAKGERTLASLMK